MNYFVLPLASFYFWAEAAVLV